MELVKRCKEAIENNDLQTASEFWVQIYKKYAPTPEEIKMNPEEAGKRFQQLHDLMDNFTDEEVYIVTDYIKEQNSNN